MSASYMDFLASASQMLSQYSQSQSEMDLRNAVSRSYYAAYLHARDSASKLKVVSQSTKKGTHERLADRYVKTGGDSVGSIGGMLLAAHRTRCVADYELHQNIDKAAAHKHKVQCQSILAKIDRVLAQADQQQQG